MAWDHLSVTKPHLVYIILGGFTSLFMLCSSVIKERLYIGEATVATLCGIIFGPHAANLINPLEWGNTDLITLEFSRIVLVVQCFAVGVELPKSYMERHWKSVTLLLVPVMTFGWLITSLFIWWLFQSHLNWLDSLCIAACVTATDPVLASSVVGKGKFAKRVPKHLRDLLSAESGCNDGMAFPFVYLAVYLIRYRPDANKVSYHWFLYTVLYECVFGAIYGVLIGYIARRLIRYAHEKDLIDRESFLVFYFVLALFCAGSGSILGVDDLLVGFAAGVGFSNDGWFLEKTEEAHVSNVIDLLINLAFFVYFGSIIPWAQFNSEILGTTPWRLVVLALLVLFFRRIPIMLMLKPFIPDIKTWREACFAGHFGPIGVGGLFVAILARAELETHSTTPLAVIPEEGFPHLNIIELIWPITTFLVITSIIVHGSSIAVFTLGKHINTLTLTLSYTQANEDGPSWMDRLPRIQSRSKSSMSIRRPGESDSEMDEKQEAGGLPPIGLPGQFLRRKKQEDNASRSSSLGPSRRRKKWDAGLGPGGPVSQSAIAPQMSARQPDDVDAITSGAESPSKEKQQSPEGPESPEEEIYQEGDHVVIEDEEGNVLGVTDASGLTEGEASKAAKKEGRKLMKSKEVEDGVSQVAHEQDASSPSKNVEFGNISWHQMRKKMENISGLNRREGNHEDGVTKPKPAAQKRGPALAYQFGNTIIVEDENGEVIKKYDIPSTSKKPQMDRRPSLHTNKTRQQLQRVGTWMGMGHAEGESSTAQDDKRKRRLKMEEDDDSHIRFTITSGGQRMSKDEFIKQIQQLDPKARASLIKQSNVPEEIKREVTMEAMEYDERRRLAALTTNGDNSKADSPNIAATGSSSETAVQGGGSDNEPEDVPVHSVHDDLARHTMDTRETAAQRRRRRASAGEHDLSEDTRIENRSSSSHKQQADLVIPHVNTSTGKMKQPALQSNMDEGETAAERKRREAALGVGDDDSGDDSEEEEEEEDMLDTTQSSAGGQQSRTSQIRFAEPPRRH